MIIHGETIGRTCTTEFCIWQMMIQRCANPNHHSYKDYGGRGILVCKRWLMSYTSFLHDMGRRPSRLHSLDRRDNNGNYEPSNCRWATSEEQQNNKRTSKRLTYNGETKTQAQWARAIGITAESLSARIERGLPDSEVFGPRMGQSMGKRTNRTLLTENDVREIRLLRSQGLKLTQIARRFGITFSGVSYIVLMKTWKHIR